MALDKFQPYLFVSAGEQSNKYLTPVYSDGIASFQAQRAQDLTGLTVRIDTIQEGSGDPSPDNIRPISGRTGMTVTRAGRNLLKLPYKDTNGTRNGITFTTNADGSVTINGTASPAVSGTLFASAESDLPLNVGDVLYFSAGQTYNENSAYMRLLYADNFSDIGRITRENFALTLTAAMIERGFVFQIWVPNGVTVNNMTFKPVVSLSPTEWLSPTINQTYPISWQTEAGAIYGGTLNVTTGVLTVDKAIATVSSTNGISAVGSAGHGFLIARSTGIEPKNTGSNYATGVFSDKFPASVAASSLASNAIFVDNYGRIRFNTEAQYSSVSAMFSAVGAFSVVYPVETPQTYQLTPTEVRTIAGYNQIYSDAGPVIDIKF